MAHLININWKTNQFVFFTWDSLWIWSWFWAKLYPSVQSILSCCPCHVVFFPGSINAQFTFYGFHCLNHQAIFTYVVYTSFDLFHKFLFHYLITISFLPPFPGSFCSSLFRHNIKVKQTKEVVNFDYSQYTLLNWSKISSSR